MPQWPTGGLTMAKKLQLKRAADHLTSQASVVAEAALSANDTLSQDRLFSAANTLDRLARATARKSSEAKENPVATLTEDASDSEIRKARQRRAVRCGQDVYLPSWTDATVGLPNALLRSALFASASESPGFLKEAKIASQGDTVLTFTGEGLISYDRKVFAVCLDHYRDDRPLSPGEDSPWVRTTYYQFASALDLRYGPGVHRAIRASLMRLNHANLRARVNRLSVPLPRLIEVAFDEGYMDESTPDDQLKASDHIVFRVTERMAELFGPTDWSAVPKIALTDFAGLTSWLAAFYSTHKAPCELQVDILYARTGVTCSKAEFRRMLKKALTKLQEAPQEVRVERFAITKTAVWVSMARWSYKGPCPLKVDEDI